MSNETKNCISLGQGVPFYYPDAEYFSDLNAEILKPAIHRYSSDPGLFYFREALKDKILEENKIFVNVEDIVITPGANQAFFNVLTTIAQPADEIILLTPYYFNHFMACTILGLTPVTVPYGDDFSIPTSQLEEAITAKTRAIVFVNPGNPTGRVASGEDIRKLKEIVANNNLYLISDETYEYFTYSGTKHVSVGSFDEISHKVITIGSFSKSYGIPGWRIGYYFGNRTMIGESLKIQDTVGICAPHPSQILANTLLQNRKDIVPDFVKLMKINYEIACDLLSEINWLEETPSGGAYYLFPKQLTEKPSQSLAINLIKNYQVYIVPGNGFGKSWENYFRISFANVLPEELKEAFSRLRSFTQ